MPVLNQKQELAKKADLLTKQDTLIAGTGISIAADGKTISATSTGGSTVSVTPILSSGTRVAAMEVDGTIYTLFAPTPPTVTVTQIESSGTELARVIINGVSTSIYAPEGSTVLSGTSAPTAAQGEDNNLYVQYVDNSGTLSVVATYVKLSGSWVELSAGGGSSIIPNPQGTSVGVLNSISIDGDKYSIHPENWEVTEQYIRGKYDPLNEFGWYAADQTYYIDSKISWTVCSNNFTKTNDKPALGAAFMLNNGNYYTMLISTDSSAVAFTGDKTTNTLSTTIDGVTWYYSYTNQAIYIWAGVSGITYVGYIGSMSDTVNYIIQQSQISTDHPYRNKTVQISPPAATGYLFGGGGLQNDLSDATFKVTAAGDIIGNAFHGATALANGTVGLVPAPLIADKDKFLKGDGTWAESGGGNANEQELTWAKYQELTPAQQTDGTTYYITDLNMNGTGEHFQPIIYSEAEMEIGVWTDGKPLYQKTIHTGALPSNTDWVSIPHGITNIDKVIKCTGIAITPSGDDNYYYVIPQYRTTYNVGVTFEISKTNINYTQTWLNNVTDSYVTLQYTKTTDQPGSGTWTPQGVPTVHYSTDEQVIGTWIDGSTVYEKTFSGTTNSTSIYFSNTSDVDSVISMGGYIVDSGGVKFDIPYRDTTDYISLKNDSNGVNLLCTNYFVNKDYIVTIRYTKTTD